MIYLKIKISITLTVGKIERSSKLLQTKHTTKHTTKENKMSTNSKVEKKSDKVVEKKAEKKVEKKKTATPAPAKKAIKKRRKMKNQLIDCVDYDVKNIRFEDAYTGTIPGDMPVNFTSYGIYTINPDGSEGELLLKMDKAFSFGAKEFFNKVTGAVDSITMTVTLHSRDGPTDREKKQIEVLEGIVSACIEFLVSRKKELKQPDLEARDLKKITFMTYKKDDDGNLDLESSPTIYPKLNVMKAKDVTVKNEDGEEETLTKPMKVITRLVKKREPELDEEGNDIGEDEEYKYSELVGTHCELDTWIVRPKSIFFAPLIRKVQIEMPECIAEVRERTTRKLLYNVAKPSTVSHSGKSSKDLLFATVKRDDEEGDSKSPPASPKGEKKDSPAPSSKKEKKEEKKKDKKKDKKVASPAGSPAASPKKEEKKNSAKKEDNKKKDKKKEEDVLEEED